MNTSPAGFIALPVTAGIGLGIMLIGYFARFNSIFHELLRLDARRIEKQRETTALHKKRIAANHSNEDTASLDTQIRISEARLKILNDQFGIIVSRYDRMKFSIVFICLSLVLLFLGGIWASLATYWEDFWYFSVVSFFLALSMIFVGLIFAALELSEAFLINQSEWKFVQAMFSDSTSSKAN